jgi:nucleotide-binding universal stress UspA family protein
MSIKRILLPLAGPANYAGEVKIALSAAKALGAHVEALFITQPAPPPRAGFSSNEFAYARRTVAAQSASWLAEDQALLAQARERFAEACAESGIPLVPAGERALTLPAASWREAEGSHVAITAQRAAAFDLVIAASPSVMETPRAIAEQALLRTRRPVLLSPARQEAHLTDTAMIAWDESPECWHAVSAAGPFLKLAKSVQVVSVDRDTERRGASQADVLAYLRCHGIEATARVVQQHSPSIGDTLLSTAGEDNVGLMVMGAYSHSRLRELLFGGVTRHILQNAAARPVFLAH